VLVTEDAKEQLRERLLDQTSAPEIGLRLEFRSPENFGLALDRQAEGDQVIEYEGSKVLLIGEDVADLADKLILSVEDAAEGPKLVVLKA